MSDQPQQPTGEEEKKIDKKDPNWRRAWRCEQLFKSMKCWPQCLDMLAMGRSVREVAEFIKSEKNELKQYSQAVVETYLYHYVRFYDKKYILSQAPCGIKIYEASMFEFNVQTAHKMLAAIQFDRVMMDLENEKKIGATSKHTNDNIRLMNSILKTIEEIDVAKNTVKHTTRMVKSTMPHGDGPIVAIEHVKQQYISKFGAATADAILNPESRRKLLNVIERARAFSSPAVQRAIAEGAQAMEKERDKDDRI